MGRMKKWILDSIVGSFLQSLIPAGFWPWVLTGLVTAATVVSGYLWKWPLPVLLVAGTIVMACVSVSINELSAWRERRQSAKNSALSLNVSGLEFFPTIDELRSSHPLSETFKPGNEIHAYFLSGEGVFAEHSDYIKSVKRLILPIPTSKTIASLQSVSGTKVDYTSQINRFRNLAEKNNVPVRFFQEFIGVSLLFCNPNQRNGWAQVGIIIPGSESSERHHYRLHKEKQEKAFLSLYKTFERLWDSSEVNAAPTVMPPEAMPGYIPMKAAAELLYREARSAGSSLARAAEETSGSGIGKGSPEDILNYMATHIAGKMAVYGKKAPSTAFDKISDREIKGSCFSEGATTLRDLFYDKSIYFTDLAVRSDELRELIAEVHFKSGYDSTNS